MNCFVWILLLLGCGGSCGNSCSTWSNSGSNSCSTWNNGCGNNWNGCNPCGCNHCGCIQPRDNGMMNRCENSCNSRMDCSNPCDGSWNDNNSCDCDNHSTFPSARPWGERNGYMSPPPVPGRVREDGCGCND